MLDYAGLCGSTPRTPSVEPPPHRGSATPPHPALLRTGTRQYVSSTCPRHPFIELSPLSCGPPPVVNGAASIAECALPPLHRFLPQGSRDLLHRADSRGASCRIVPYCNHSFASSAVTHRLLLLQPLSASPNALLVLPLEREVAVRTCSLPLLRTLRGMPATPNAVLLEHEGIRSSGEALPKGSLAWYPLGTSHL